MFPSKFDETEIDEEDPTGRKTDKKDLNDNRSSNGTLDTEELEEIEELEAEELDLAEQVGWLVASVRSSLHRYAGTVIYAIHSSFPASLPSVYF